MSNYWAAPGVKCQCINDKFYIDFGLFHTKPDIHPIKGNIYTIHNIQLFWGRVFLVLEELRFTQTVKGLPPEENLWPVTSFKPLNNRDVKLFNSLLHPKPEDVERFKKEKKKEKV